jgi:hypothetical protein
MAYLKVRFETLKQNPVGFKLLVHDCFDLLYVLLIEDKRLLENLKEGAISEVKGNSPING